MQSLYEILGVGKHATPAEIKSAFRNRARDNHPDTSTDKPDADKNFREINNAYTILSDPAERTRYNLGEIDENGTATSRSTRTNDRSVYDDFARRSEASNTQHTRSVRIDGSDVYYILRVDFLDGVNGAVKHISMTNGRRIKVSIPSGTKHKQMLRLKGQGVPGVGGGKDGAALVEILIRDNSLFRIVGNDIIIDQPVPLKLAVLGGTLEIPGSHGKPLNIEIPAHSNSGDTIRIPSMGMKTPDGKSGDQIMTILISLPSDPDIELAAFLTNWEPKDETLDQKQQSATA